MTYDDLAMAMVDIVREFPSASVSAVQYLMTFPNLVVVVVSFCMTGITRIFSKRMIAAAGLGMACLAGILAGFLWSSTYLVYLLAVPGLILTLLFVPGAGSAGKIAVPKERKIKIPSFAWKYFGIAAVFMLLFYIGPTNVSLLLEERGMGSAAMARTASTLLLLGGFLMGLIFGKIAGRIGENTIPLGFLVLFAGYGIVYLTDSVIGLYTAFLLIGTSNTLVLPQCMGQMVTADKAQSTFLLSLAFAVANLGTFLAPVLTALSRIVMGNELAGSRFLLACILAALLAVLSKIGMMLGSNRAFRN